MLAAWLPRKRCRYAGSCLGIGDDVGQVFTGMMASPQNIRHSDTARLRRNPCCSRRKVRIERAVDRMRVPYAGWSSRRGASRPRLHRCAAGAAISMTNCCPSIAPTLVENRAVVSARQPADKAHHLHGRSARLARRRRALNGAAASRPTGRGVKPVSWTSLIPVIFRAAHWRPPTRGARTAHQTAGHLPVAWSMICYCSSPTGSAHLPTICVISHRPSLHGFCR